MTVIVVRTSGAWRCTETRYGHCIKVNRKNKTHKEVFKKNGEARSFFENLKYKNGTSQLDMYCVVTVYLAYRYTQHTKFVTLVITVESL